MAHRFAHDAALFQDGRVVAFGEARTLLADAGAMDRAGLDAVETDA